MKTGDGSMSSSILHIFFFSLKLYMRMKLNALRIEMRLIVVRRGVVLCCSWVLLICFTHTNLCHTCISPLADCIISTTATAAVFFFGYQEIYLRRF